jgi:protein-S-isoprenylcysteine O-methyltransferase Ste14
MVGGGLMWLVSETSPEFGFALPAPEVIGIGLAVVGATICLSAVVSFIRARTTINPMKPQASSSLVVSGIYKVSRNPMYLGFLLALAGLAFFLSNLLTFLVLWGFVFYISRFQIEPEERALRTRFRDEFVRYAARVRRWL